MEICRVQEVRTNMQFLFLIQDSFLPMLEPTREENVLHIVLP